MLLSLLCWWCCHFLTYSWVPYFGSFGILISWWLITVFLRRQFIFLRKYTICEGKGTFSAQFCYNLFSCSYQGAWNFQLIFQLIRTDCLLQQLLKATLLCLNQIINNLANHLTISLKKYLFWKLETLLVCKPYWMSILQVIGRYHNFDLNYINGLFGSGWPLNFMIWGQHKSPEKREHVTYISRGC